MPTNMPEAPQARELRALLKRIAAVNPAMPDDAAGDDEWDAWIDLNEIQSTIAGWAGREVGSWRPDDDEYLAVAQEDLAAPGVRELLGDRRADFEQLISLLYHRLR